jgi:hypothetical protein
MKNIRKIETDFDSGIRGVWSLMGIEFHTG